MSLDIPREITETLENLKDKYPRYRLFDFVNSTEIPLSYETTVSDTLRNELPDYKGIHRTQLNLKSDIELSWLTAVMVRLVKDIDLFESLGKSRFFRGFAFLWSKCLCEYTDAVPWVICGYQGIRVPSDHPDIMEFLKVFNIWFAITHKSAHIETHFDSEYTNTWIKPIGT